MDLLKTMLLYMSLTFASTVQSAPLPSATPVPTPEPTAVVTPAPTDVPTTASVETAGPIEGIPTPAPTPAATPAYNTVIITATPVPEPTMTPNRAYRTLNNKSRGEDVKRLQERLKELGYLEGAVDGSYGRQTRKAVQLFQNANGLAMDGIAGRMTQTILFEDPNVRPNPAMTAAPEATPEPSAEPSAEPAETAEAPAEAAETAEPTTETNPEPTAEPTAEPTPEPTPVPAEIVEVPDAAVTLGQEKTPLKCLRQVNGILMEAEPRVYTADGVLISAEDICGALDGWYFHKDKDNRFELTAGDTVLQLAYDEARQAMTVTDSDGKASEVGNDQIRMKDGDVLISASFLKNWLNTEADWNAESKTLNITIAE